MRNTFKYAVLLTLGFLFRGSSILAQVSISTSTGLAPSSNLGLFQVNAFLDCPATITFTTPGSPAGDWQVYDNAVGLFPPLGVIKDGGTDITNGYLRSGVGTFTITLKSLAVGTYNFGVKFNGANDIDVTMNFGGTCPGSVTPVLSVTLTKTSGNECLGIGNIFPGYSITLSDGLGSIAATREYEMALNSAPVGFAIAPPLKITIPSGSASVTIPNKIGSNGQTATANGVFPFTLTVTDLIAADGQAAPVTTLPQTLTIADACQDNALYVMVNPSGVATAAIPQPNLKMQEVKTWVQRISFGKAVFNPFRKSGGSDDTPIVLANAFQTYQVAPKLVLSELVQEVVNSLLGTNANLLNNVKYLVLFLNTSTDAEVGPAGYWAIKERIYSKPGGGTIKLGVSIHKNGAGVNEIAHGVAHQLGMKDLNVYDQTANSFVTIANTPTDWDIMAIPSAGLASLKNTHPMTEHKFFRGSGADVWVAAAGAPGVEYVQTSGGDITKTIIAVKDWVAASTKPIALALQISTATTLTSANSYAWIEARPHTPGVDEVGAGSGFDGIVVYYANKFLNTDGSGRIQGYDMNGASAGNPIFYAAGSSTNVDIGTTGWKVKSCTKNGAEYNIVLSYSAPSVSFDAAIHKGATKSWLSPDIKTVIPGCTADACEDPTNGENPGLIAGNVDTKVIATIHNKSGTGKAKVIVKFSISRSSVTSGTTTIIALNKTTFATVYAEVPPSTSSVDVFGILHLADIEGTSWGAALINALKATPSQTHYCLYVDIEPIELGDADLTNHSAQKNSGFIADASASPYPVLKYEFFASNPGNQSRLVLFEVKNNPGTWQIKLTPDRTMLAPNEEKKIEMEIEVPADFPHCIDVPLQITAHTVVDHTIIPLGGIMTNIKTRHKQDITVGAKVSTCNKDTIQIKYGANAGAAGQPLAATYTKATYPGLMSYYLKNVMFRNEKEKRGCATIYTTGCTNPKQPNSKILMIYQDPSGNPVYKEILTDANGCYNDEHVVVEGGEWTTTAMFRGDACIQEVKAVAMVTVPLPVTGDQDDDGMKDPDEIQGDEDNDGIPGQLDDDSDNDGIKDGDEPAGNYDCDSYANSVDTDSDNDGIPDGSDPTPYGAVPKFKLFFSGMYHRFDFDSDLPINDGSGFNLRAGINLHSRWGLEAEFGYTSTTSKSNVSGKTYNVNLNALYYFTNKPIMPYLTAGAGALLFSGFSNSDNTFALNGGLGVMASQPGFSALALRAEIKAHYGFGGYSTNGNFNVQYSVGLTYRFKTSATPCKIDKIVKLARRAN